MDSTELTQNNMNLFSDVCSIIDGARGRLANYANTEVIVTKWQIGIRIKRDVLKDKRADYGKTIVKDLSKKLTDKYGKGWGVKTLWHCPRCGDFYTRGNCLRSAETIDLDPFESYHVC